MIVNDRNVTRLLSGAAYTLHQVGLFLSRTDRGAFGMQLMNVSKSLDNMAFVVTREERSKKIEQHNQSIIEQEQLKEKLALKPVPRSIELNLPFEEGM